MSSTEMPGKELLPKVEDHGQMFEWKPRVRSQKVGRKFPKEIHTAQAKTEFRILTT